MEKKKRTDGISICIPNWNHRNYLPRSVRCAMKTAKALASQGVGCEVLILDDYSRDGSQKLMLQLAMLDGTGALHAVAGTENMGLGAMRSRSLVESKYKWVCFLDADNELIPENMVLFYQAARDTGATLVYGNIIVRSDGNESVVTGLYSNDIIHEGILDRNYVDAMAVIDAEQAIQVGGYTDRRSTSEDWEFMLHLIAESHKIVFVPLQIGTYFNQAMSLIQEIGPIDVDRMHRIYDQRKVGLPAGFRSYIYHPNVGYLVS